MPHTHHFRRAVGALAAATATALAAPAVAAAAGPQGGLPDDRAYEMVSPVEKGGSDVRELFGNDRAAVDGGAVTFTSFAKFPGSGGVGAATSPRYISRREGGRWVTRSADPPIEPNALMGSLTLLTNLLQPAEAFSPDLGMSAVVDADTRVTPDAHPNRISLYRHAFADDTYEYVSKSMLSPLGPDPAFFFFWDHPFPVGQSRNMEHIVFRSHVNLTADATGPEDRSNVKLYEWEQGEVRLVSVLPDGSSTTSSVSLGYDYYPNDPKHYTRFERAVSEDGLRIVFTTEPQYTNPEAPSQSNGGKVMMREGNGTPSERTVWISQSEKAVPDPVPGPARFEDASANGSRVFFRTPEQLVDEDTDEQSDLYAYDVEAPVGERLTLLSAGDEPATRVAGVIGSSADGATIYFGTFGRLRSGDPASPDPAAPYRIYRWRNGVLTYIAPLGEHAGDDYCGVNVPIAHKPDQMYSDYYDPCNWVDDVGTFPSGRVTRDGRYLLFRSNRDILDLGVESPNFYLYDGNTGETVCASCSSEPGGRGVIAVVNRTPFFTVGYRPRLLVERAGGVQVYFTSRDALAPGDINGQPDVYRYDSVDRRTALLSSGSSGSPSWFADASADGKDVFFVTRERLSSWDVDGTNDMYDVRVGGGETAPPRIEPVCAEDGCQGAPSERPQRRTPATITGSGAGDVSSARSRTAQVRIAGVSASGRRARVVVSVDGPGVVRLVARAKVPGGRSWVAGRASTRARTAGRVRLSVPLGRRVRTTVADGRRVRLRLTAAFKGADTKRTLTLTGKGR